MTSGRRPAQPDFVRAARSLAAAALLAFAPWAPAAGWDVATLMELLSRNKPGRAAFNETRHLALLDRPLEVSGELRFTPPNRLEKRTLAPGTDSMVVDGDVLTLERAGRRHTLSLREHPEVAVFIESIRGTLAGDRAALERAYALSLEGEAKRWNLVLKPLSPVAAGFVARIEVSGRQADIHRVEIFQADGDRTLMMIRRMDP